MVFLIYGVPCLANGFYDVAYSGIEECENARYFNSIKPQDRQHWVNALHSLWYSYKVNTIARIPFKKIFFPTFVPKDVKENDRVCFIFFSRWFADRVYVDYVKWLKDRYRNAKFVCYYQDTIASHGNVDNEWVKQFFDLTMSYDNGDAVKYGLRYYPTPYTKLDIVEAEAYKSDAYYLGTSKNRLPQILSYYDQLIQVGLNAQFYITGNDDDAVKKQYPGIHFIESMSYMENLKFVRNTKCIIEVMQEGAKGITPRTWEAIAYSKVLLTNNEFLHTTEYWNDTRMTLNPEDVVSYIRKTDRDIDKIGAERLHPKNLIDYISEQLKPA